MIRWKCEGCLRLHWFFRRSCRPCQQRIIERAVERELIERMTRDAMSEERSRFMCDLSIDFDDTCDAWDENDRVARISVPIALVSLNVAGWLIWRAF